jgi:hypothetical protein
MVPIAALKEKFKAKVDENGKTDILCVHREEPDAMEILPVVMSGDSIDAVLEKRSVSMEDVGAVVVTPFYENSLMQLALLGEKKLITTEALANGIANLLCGNITFVELVKCPHEKL